MLFEKSSEILEKVEGFILEVSKKQIDGWSFLTKIREWFRINLMVPIQSVRVGLEKLDIMAVLTRFVISFILEFFLILVLLKIFPELHPLVSLLSILIFGFPIFLSLFSSSSQTARRGIKEQYIEYASGLIEECNLTNSLDPLKENMKLFENNTQEHNNLIKWIVGGIWGLWFFSISNLISEASKSKTPINVETVFPYAIGLIIISVIYICVQSYLKSSQVIFLSINFAINELKHHQQLIKDDSIKLLTEQTAKSVEEEFGREAIRESIPVGK